MLTYEIMNSTLLNTQDTESIVPIIEEGIRLHSMDIALRTTLSTCRGSIHYHLRSDSQRGILEVTYWPSKMRLWLDIHDNRKADWNERLIEPFAQTLAASLEGTAIQKNYGCIINKHIAEL